MKITFSKFKNATIKNFKRVLKVQQFGVKTAAESMPFGDDSAPLENMVAIFAETSNNSEPVIIGYINKHQLAGPGEKRIFSLKPDGTVATYIYLKSDGVTELGGTANFAVKYNELETEFNKLKSTLNSLISKYNAHVHAAPNTPTPAVEVVNTSNISLAKNNKIKTS